MSKQALSRRTVLKLGVVGATAALAGCSTPPAAAPTLPPAPAATAQTITQVVTATPPPAQTTLTFFNWASAEEATRKNIEKITAKFQADNPGVTIKNVPYGFGEIQNQIIIATTGGNPPDIMQQSSNMPFELAGMGALEPLDAYVSKEVLADITPANLKAGQYGDKLYAFPWAITPHAFWYNKKLMQKLGLDPAKPPKTLDDLNAAFKTISDASKGQIYGMGLDTTKRQYALVHQWPWMLTFGAEPFKDGKPNWDSPDMAAYFGWLRTITNAKYNPPGLILRDFRQFAAGDKEVFAWDGTYWKGQLVGINKDMADDKTFQDTWSVQNIPQGKLGKPVTVTDIHQLSISKACKNKEMAYKFVQVLAGSDLAITDYLIPMGAIPPLNSAISKFKDRFSDQNSQTYIKDIIPNAVPMPFGPKFTAAAEFMLVAMQQVVTTNDPIDKILKDVQANLKVVYGL